MRGKLPVLTKATSSYQNLASSVISYHTDPWQHGLHLFNMIKHPNVVNGDIIFKSVLQSQFMYQSAINVCACQNQGVCTTVEEDDAENSADSSENKFSILSCTCQNGYTGTFCDADLDACEENFQPCYPGVTCNDLPAPANETGFKCDPCPNGYSGDGIECSGNSCSLFKNKFRISTGKIS